ncbi:hypothetical protein KJA16_00605 [Patescibacteria group bacterium]|nr:hypothetical protein [Patescibacteria group bacterium]
MSKVIIVIIVVIIVAGLGYWIYQAVSTPKEETRFGTIEGSLSYPSEFIPPDMKVCAENVETEELYCTEEHIKDSKYTYGEGYKVEVPAGNYYVSATTEMIKGYKAYYSEFVTCGFNPDCLSHEPVLVTVEAGQTITSIDPQDWYKTF